MGAAARRPGPRPWGVILFLRDGSSDTNTVTSPQPAVVSRHLTIIITVALVCSTKLCLTSPLKTLLVCYSCRALRHAGNIYNSLYTRTCMKMFVELSHVEAFTACSPPSPVPRPPGPLPPPPSAASTSPPLSCSLTTPHTHAQLLLCSSPFHAQHLCTARISDLCFLTAAAAVRACGVSSPLS